MIALAFLLVLETGSLFWADSSTNETGFAGLHVGGAPIEAIAPGPPTIILAAQSGSFDAQIVWADRSSNESGFRIYRRSGRSAYLQVGTVGANVTTFTDRGLRPNTNYVYRVGAFNAVNEVLSPETAARTPRR